MCSFAYDDMFHVGTVCRSVERRGELQKITKCRPKDYTQYKTQWGVRIFESWKKERRNDESNDVSVVELLSYR